MNSTTYEIKDESHTVTKLLSQTKKRIPVFRVYRGDTAVATFSSRALLLVVCLPGGCVT